MGLLNLYNYYWRQFLIAYLNKYVKKNYCCFRYFLFEIIAKYFLINLENC